MQLGTHNYTTKGNVLVSRTVTETSIELATEEVLSRLDSQRGGLLRSSYEYPGRYKRWGIGFVNPPLELSTVENAFTFTAHNDRGKVLLPYLSERLSQHAQLQNVQLEERQITGFVRSTEQSFCEEERSRQPSVFSVVREVLYAFESVEDEHLGLYGAFGYDLVFQFEQLSKSLSRSETQRDLVLYLPDELMIVDYYQRQAFRVEYDFATQHGATKGLFRSGEVIDYKGQNLTPTQASDHAPGEYEQQVENALDYFRRGDLFEVVPSQSFFKQCQSLPSDLFRTLMQINPSPYGFLFNLGGEYLIGASPEMFVRVEGKRVETCPISGTIRRGETAIEDAAQILQLLNSGKDEAELTMCTDVDRNDKSRICEPGSVQVIGRRQIEMYSHLIHTVDHVEGTLRPEFDVLDAFLTHLWAVTVTGAPKRWAMQFIEKHERSSRRWYGGAVGYLNFKGDLNTGLILRTIQLKDTIAEVRVGATVLYDSDAEAEAQETITKAAALFQTIYQTQHQRSDSFYGLDLSMPTPQSQSGRRVLLIDHEDSFVHTLANYIRQTGASVKTLRHGFPESVLESECPDLVVLSPGPGKPSDFRVSETINACLKRNIPIFGVCLGLQSIVEAFGGKLGILSYPQHGKVSRVSIVAPSNLFQNLPQSFDVGRYHSLYALPEALPKALKVTAVSEDGVIMAIEHRSLPIAAVQFHPESIMTLVNNIGLSIIQNAVQAYAKAPVHPLG
ncbi:MAG TPA: anthranilate synthase [Leptolyngbya sp.]|nr:anthranilate synthase [Leptolyngbya sp.]